MSVGIASGFVVIPMSDDEQTVWAMTQSGFYHTDEDCVRITENAREWTLKEAQKAGRVECGHCQSEEHPGCKKGGEQLSTRLSKADPEDLGLSPEGKRASASLWFAAAWLAIMAASTIAGVALYFVGVLL